MKKRGIIYARQSVTKGDESASIEQQVANCRTWAERNGVEVVGVYEDANTPSECYPNCESGVANAKVDRGYQTWLKEQRTKRKPYKDGLGQAFDLLRDERIDYIIVNTQNRLGRSALNSNLNNYITAYLMEHRCSIADVSAGHVTDFSDRVMLAFRAMQDALDYQSVYEKRRQSIEAVERRKNAYRKYSNAVGVTMADGVVCFNPTIVPVIEEVFAMTVAGETYGAVLNAMNTKHREQAKGRQWYISNLRSILANPVYAGYMYNVDGVLGRATNIPNPIVSYAMWRQAQEVVAGRKTNGMKSHVRGEEPRHWLPLSGYLQCPCGRRMMMFLDRGKIAYHCVNGKDHTTTMYVDDRVLAIVQKTFVLSLIESRRTLATVKRTSEAVDAIKVELERMQASLRAKFRMIQTDEDYKLFEQDIVNLKSEIQTKRAELTEAEAMSGTEQERWLDGLERDFHAVMEGELLGRQDYMRLLQATVKRLTVRDWSLDVETTSGVVIPIPRLLGKHRSKRLMDCDLLCDTTGESVEDIVHYQLHFHDSGDWSFDDGECVFENEELSVFVHRGAK